MHIYIVLYNSIQYVLLLFIYCFIYSETMLFRLNLVVYFQQFPQEGAGVKTVNKC